MMQPMYYVPGEFPWLGIGIVEVGLVGLIMGFVVIRWMTRDPEDGPDHWRSHRRR